MMALLRFIDLFTFFHVHSIVSTAIIGHQKLLVCKINLSSFDNAEDAYLVQINHHH